jgi:hypothetical protein
MIATCDLAFEIDVFAVENNLENRIIFATEHSKRRMSFHEIVIVLLLNTSAVQVHNICNTPHTHKVLFFVETCIKERRSASACCGVKLLEEDMKMGGLLLDCATATVPSRSRTTSTK